ncbi:hypothetical protein HY570_02680 [Candidatus Micrarchaeota archaeon]|nr:hypothetical protein [Candidatus Micrarchaeota archaeon]
MKIEFTTKNTVILSIAVFVLLLIVGYVFLKPTGKFETYFVDDKFTPVSDLKLKAGEAYVYRYTIENQSSDIEYLVNGILDNCTQVTGTSLMNKSIKVMTCFDIKNGQPDKIVLSNDFGVRREVTPANFSFLQSWMFFDFFQPWMLGAKEGFVWNSSRIIEHENLKVKTVFMRTYEVKGVETKNGREAYKVDVYFKELYNDVTRNNGYEGTIWIDKEKRVLISYSSVLSKIDLVKAPFALAK